MLRSQEGCSLVQVITRQAPCRDNPCQHFLYPRSYHLKSKRTSRLTLTLSRQTCVPTFSTSNTRDPHFLLQNSNYWHYRCSTFTSVTFLTAVSLTKFTHRGQFYVCEYRKKPRGRWDHCVWPYATRINLHTNCATSIWKLPGCWSFGIFDQKSYTQACCTLAAIQQLLPRWEPSIIV